jgi:hypothetical protein
MLDHFLQDPPPDNYIRMKELARKRKYASQIDDLQERLKWNPYKFKNVHLRQEKAQLTKDLANTNNELRNCIERNTQLEESM